MVEHAPKPADGKGSDNLHRDGPIGIVVAGAAARGVYEAGVLAELLPRLFPRGSLDQAILVGTSSGAINVALWAHFADGNTPLDTVAQRVCDFWLQFDQPQVFAFNVLQLLRRGRIPGLLDTAPLKKNAPRRLGLCDLTTGVSKGRVRALGVVATTCPQQADGGRSRVFYETRDGTCAPQSKGAVDYVRTAVTIEHVLASAAIPFLFPAIEVTQPKSAHGYYIDGAVRLNAPIHVAQALGAKRIIVVSSHDTTYPRAPVMAPEQPDVVDSGAQVLHTLLADKMIEDLRTLKHINALVQQSEQPLYSPYERKPYEILELIEAAPKHGELAYLAQKAVSLRSGSIRDRWIRLKYWAFRALLAGVGSGSGNDELLSYLLFDKNYAQQQIALGREDGIAAAAAGWSTGTAPVGEPPRASASPRIETR